MCQKWRDESLIGLDHDLSCFRESDQTTSATIRELGQKFGSGEGSEGMVFIGLSFH
jgi:uncharacterized protein involved in tellurium resistance